MKMERSIDIKEKTVSKTAILLIATMAAFLTPLWVLP
jgi:hypothetical protein